MIVKILFVAHHTWSFLNFRGLLAQTIKKLDHDILVCGPENDPELVDRIKRMGFQFHHIPMVRTGMNPLKDFMYLVRLYSLMRRESPDIVFNMAIKPVIYGSLAARLLGISRVFSLFPGLGYSFTGENKKGAMIRALVRILFKLSLSINQKIFFQNPDDLETLLNSKLIGKTQAVLINGSGVDLRKFEPSEPVEAPIVFLLISRMIRDKGIREYIEAARIVKSAYPNVQIRILGPTDSNPTAIPLEQIQYWHEEGMIHYLGVTDDVRPMIKEASVFVLPSYREGTPRSVLEAMAMGRPIITTDAPGCRETVSEGVNGFLVKPRDVPSLVEAMKQFIDNPGLISQMGRKSRELAESKFDVLKVNADVVAQMQLY